MCDKGTKLIETTIETIPTPTRGSTCSMMAISPPPGLELPDGNTRLSTSSFPIDIYSSNSKQFASTPRTKPKRKVRAKYNGRNQGLEPTRSKATKNGSETGARSPRNVNVGTPISLFAATSGNRDCHTNGPSSKPALLSIPGRINKRASQPSCPGSGRAISLVEATVGTPISLSTATAHLPRTSIYTTHIDADLEGPSLMSPRSHGLYAASPLTEMYLPSAFGMANDYSGVTDGSYSRASPDFYSVAAANLSESMRPSLQMRSPTNAGTSTPVTLSLWGQKEPLHNYYASLTDNGERSTTSDEEDESRGDRSPAQKWLEEGTNMLQAALAAEAQATDPPAQSYFPWPVGSVDEGSFPHANMETMWEGLDKFYDDPSLRPLTQNASTLVWISEMAFKQGGTGTRETLESFGVPLKAHKSAHKAIRSLGKREAKVIRFDSAVVIVSAKEASEFMQFLASASEGGAEIRPCCVIVGPGSIHPDLHRFMCFLHIPQSTCVRFCQSWEDIYSLVSSMLEPPLQSV